MNPTELLKVAPSFCLARKTLLKEDPVRLQLELEPGHAGDVISQGCAALVHW